MMLVMMLALVAIALAIGTVKCHPNATDDTATKISVSQRRSQCTGPPPPYACGTPSPCYEPINITNQYHRSELFSGDYKFLVNKGIEATPHSWPWAVLAGDGYKSSLVMTAAHCLETTGESTEWYVTPCDLEVIAGVHNRKVDLSRAVVRRVSKMQIDAKYDECYGKGGTLCASDIAILTLEEPLQFNDYIKAICTPSPGLRPRLDARSTCVLVGWGRTECYWRESKSDTLQQLQMTIVDDSTCAANYSNFDRLTTVCAIGSNGGGGSKGDSGGPLACRNRQNAWFLAGVVKGGICTTGMSWFTRPNLIRCQAHSCSFVPRPD